MSQLPPDRRIGFLAATSIVIANMVGTGIFGSLGFQVAVIPSGFPILLLWLAGGVISICGTLCYAELASMFPRSGGEYRLLNAAWPPLVGFLSGWVSITAGFTTPIALNAALLGAYLEGITGHPSWWFALGVIILVTSIHLGNLTRIARFQIAFTSSKILLIITLGTLAFAMGTRQDVSFVPIRGDAELIFSPAFAVSLVYVLYAYAGWNAATYMIDEIRDPQKLVPRAIIVGTLLVTVLYLYLNAAFLYATPIDSLAGEPEAGLIASHAILGNRGGDIMGLIIAFGLISTISSMTWAGPRVTAEIGKDYPALGFLARGNRHAVPAIAILLQSLLATILVLSSTFEQLLHYIQALLTLSSLGVVIGMMWLRIRCPDVIRPFRSPWFPLVPLVFILSTGGILFFQIQERPVQCAWGGLTLLLGLLVHRFIARSSR